MRSSGSRTWTARHPQLVRVAVSVLVIGGGLFALLNVPGWTYDWAAVWGDSGTVSHYLAAIWVTVLVSAGGMAVGLVLGVAAGLMRMSRNVIVHQLGTLYVELVRGTPLLVQILILYYCIALMLRALLDGMGAGIEILDYSQSKLIWGIVALGVFAGAYIAEIVRAALESIDRGQTEAAVAQGMTRSQVFRLVLFPQALRRMIPPLTNQFVSLIKDSSLLSIIGVAELTFRAKEILSSTYTVFEVYLPLAALYLLLTVPVSLLARRLELRLTA